MKRRLVIIGNGMAATRLAETLVARGGDKFQIVIIGDEPGRPITVSSCHRYWGGKKTAGANAAAARGVVSPARRDGTQR